MEDGQPSSGEADDGRFSSSETEAAPRRFVILAAPRTGSNMLCSMLNSHPTILCHHELFNPEGIHYALDRRDVPVDPGALAERDSDPIGFLDRVWRRPHGASAIGFKLNRGQNEAVFRTVLAKRTIRKIILLRENRIRAFVSESIARRTGHWESYAFSDQSSSTTRIRVDVRELQDHVAANDRYYAAIRETLSSPRQQWLEVRYEDLSRPSVQRRILRYLGAPAEAALQPATRRVNPGELRALVTNYGELSLALSGSELEDDLEKAERNNGVQAAHIDGQGTSR